MDSAIELKPGESMFLLPPAADKCQICAVTHDPEQPHNAQSLFYQVKFNMEHGRAPSWLDAMAHCDDAVRTAWTSGLNDLGVDVEGGAILPRGAANG
jgi:hypothetical protein